MRNRKQIAAIKLAAIMLCAVTVICTLVFFGYRAALKTMYPLKCTQTVEQYSKEYDLPTSLVYAVIRTESGFDPQAHSNADARGLMQITPETFEWLQSKAGETLPVEALNEEETGIRYGCFFLRMLLDEFGARREAAAAYHAGRGQVNAWLADPDVSPDGKTLADIPYPDTAYYVKKVTKAQNIYEKLYGSEVS